MTEDKEGKYCTVCGGVVPDEIKVRKILVDGKEVGIDQLDRILDDVMQLGLSDETRISEELVKRVRVFNYVPSKKIPAYSLALLSEYQKHASLDRHDP